LVTGHQERVGDRCQGLDEVDGTGVGGIDGHLEGDDDGIKASEAFGDEGVEIRQPITGSVALTAEADGGGVDGGEFDGAELMGEVGEGFSNAMEVNL